MTKRARVAILVSGGGSNMESLVRAAQQGQIPHAEIALVVSNRADAGALAKAQALNVPAVVVSSKGTSDTEFQEALLQVLVRHQIDIVCLAGYLKKIGPDIVQRFNGKMLNIHPALLPKYGGAGMYGHFVHEAVIQAKEKESGCSVHLVDDEFDHGATLAQTRVPVLPGDTPELLAKRILEQEHLLYPKVLAKFCEEWTHNLRHPGAGRGPE